MSPAEFKRAGETLFGNEWKKEFSRILRKDYVTIWRYANGYTKIPHLVEIAIKTIKASK